MHCVAIIRLKDGVPCEVLEAARRDIRNANEKVSRLFDVHYYIQVVDQPHSQDGALTLALLEDALRYIRKSSKFSGVRRVILCSDNAKNYSSSLVARSLPLLALSTSINITKGQNVVTPYQAEFAVSQSLPSSAVALITLKKTDDGQRFLCDALCANRSLRSVIHGISTKRRIEYTSDTAILYDFAAYSSTRVRKTTILIETKGYLYLKADYERRKALTGENTTMFGVLGDVMRESSLAPGKYT
eukprot:IDg676t1